MKILHILDHSLPLHSGYTFRSQNIFREQRKMGFDPVILTSSKHEASWEGERLKKETIGGFDYYRTGPVEGSVLPFMSERQLMSALRKRLMAVIEIEKPEILHAHSPVLNAFPTIKAGKKFNIPVVYEIRAFWEDAAVDHGTYKENSIKYRITRALETRACKKVDHVAILCNGLKQDLIKRGIPANKITPVFNGVNPDDFKPTPPDEEYMKEWNLEGKKVIGFIGSFYRYEGLDLLIKAFARIADKYPDLTLLLVGGGEMEKELKSQAKILGLNSSVQGSMVHGPRILFPGRIPHERVPGVYSMIDILAYPRYPMRLTELVTPLKPLEAMAMGNALVASDVGGHHELIKHGETGLLFEAGNENALAETLDRLLADERVCSHLKQTGEKWVRMYHSWTITTEVYSDIYDKVARQ